VGSVHTWLHRFDAAVPAMLSIAYVATYLGGEVLPGSDMAMSYNQKLWIAGLFEGAAYLPT
jgi:hypothetical protein